MTTDKRIITRSTHRCVECKRIRKAGATMYVRAIFIDGKYTHEYRCSLCEGKGTIEGLTEYHGDRGVWQG